MMSLPNLTFLLLWVTCLAALVGPTFVFGKPAGIVVHAPPPEPFPTGGDDGVEDAVLDGGRGVVRVAHAQQEQQEMTKRDIQGVKKMGEQWCNQYFCLTATIPASYTTSDSATASKDTTKANTTITATEITYSLVSRTEDAVAAPVGWLAVGVGKQMMGGKIWVVWWPDQQAGERAGQCVLSERDGTGHRPPTITAEPIALLLPNSNTTAKGKKRSNDATTTTTATLQTPFECTWKVDVSQFPYFDGGWQGVVSRATPMDMMWAYFSTPPVPIQGSTQEDGAGAGIRMHSAFGTFEIDFRKQLVQQEQNGGEGGAGEDDGGKKARRKMVIRAHAVVMTIAWIVTAPIAVLFARFGRGAYKWVPYHQYIQIGGTVPLALVGFFLAVSSVVMRGGTSFQGTHEILGLLLFLLLLLQVSSGLWIHHLYNAERTHRPARNYLHMVAGITLLIGGSAEVLLGIRKFGNTKWMVVSYWVWTGLLIATFVLGYTLIPRQLRQEKEAAKQRNPTTRLSRIQASFPDRDHKYKISPFPSANSPLPGEGSASKSKVRYPWQSRRVVGEGDPRDMPMLEYNSAMNPSSVPPPNSGSNRSTNTGGDSHRESIRRGMWRAA